MKNWWTGMESCWLFSRASHDWKFFCYYCNTYSTVVMMILIILQVSCDVLQTSKESSQKVLQCCWTQWCSQCSTAAALAYWHLCPLHCRLFMNESFRKLPTAPRCPFFPWSAYFSVSISLCQRKGSLELCAKTNMRQWINDALYTSHTLF